MIASLNLFIYSSLFFSAILATKDVDVISKTIPLNSTMSEDNREIYGEFLYLSNTTIVKYNFSDVNINVTFIVFQAHSHFDSITLIQDNSTANITTHGTNLGLVNIIREYNYSTTDTFYVRNPSTENNNVTVYVSVHVHINNDPVPGGCNIEFDVPIAPYMRVSTNEAYITIDAAPSSSNPQCKIINEISTEFYLLYLPEGDTSEKTYFDGIRTMMSLKNVKDYARTIPTTFWSQRRLLSAYPGTGVIFVALAHNNYTHQTTSVYVPNHSYGCVKIDKNTKSCEVPDTVLAQILCVGLLFVGIFVSFLGHRFFKTEMFLAGFFSGFIITYILVNLIGSSLFTTSLVAASGLSGVFFGSIWLLFWWLYGIPVLAVSLVALNAGFILASIFYYILPVVEPLKYDMYFWAVFVMVMFLTALAFLSVTYAGNVLCCALLGGFCTAFAFDHFIGANLKYITINLVRRTYVPRFNYVVLSPPYFWRDVLVTILGLSVAIAGWSFQQWHNIGRPPFPPHPRGTRPAAPDHSNITYGTLSEDNGVTNENIIVAPPRITAVRVESTTITERTRLLGDM